MDFAIVSILFGLIVFGLALIGVGIFGEPTFQHQVEPFSWRIVKTQVERPADTRRQRLRMIAGGAALIAGAIVLGVVVL